MRYAVHIITNSRIRWVRNNKWPIAKNVRHSKMVQKLKRQEERVEDYGWPKKQNRNYVCCVCGTKK